MRCQEASQTLGSATSNRPVGRQWEEFRRRLDSQEDSLPEDLRDDLETILDGIFPLIRATRNEGGHPTWNKVECDIIHAYLQLFCPYAKRVAAVTEHFKGDAQGRDSG
jgi:hypothetical protein